MSLKVSYELKSWNDLLDQSVLLLNPKTDVLTQELCKKLCEDFLRENSTQSFVFMASSGTTQQRATDCKIIVHKKENFLVAATEVNKTFQISNKNHWLLTLPTFHVAGLSILARAFLSHSEVSSLPYWDVDGFLNFCLKAQNIWTSLVPTQIFDLVNAEKICPYSVSGIFVGAGELSNELYIKAVNLGWPLVLSYGMTETCAMLAASEFVFAKQAENLQQKIKTEDGLLTARSLYTLPHIKAQISAGGFLEISSGALLFAKIESLAGVVEYTYYSKSLVSEDYAELKQQHNKTEVKILGRGQDYIKILGESVNLNQLRSQLRESLGKILPETDFALVALEDSRQGFVLCCCILDKYKTIIKKVELALQQYNKTVLPFQRIESICCVEDIPKTELKKIKWNQLKEVAWKNIKHHGIKVSF